MVPNTGVPPADVLAVMFPDLDPTTLPTMTLAAYNASFTAVQAAIQQRIQNLNASAVARGRLGRLNFVILTVMISL